MSKVEVVTTLVGKLPGFLPKAVVNDLELDKHTIGSVIVSVQIARDREFSESFKKFPVEINFPFEISNSTEGYCAFWNFSAETDINATGLGGWSANGLNMTVLSNSDVSCLSTHLTTFSILVDTTGVTTVSNASS
jgi:hypothetical protein